MEELQVKILSWFAFGDCLNKDISKISEIMKLLNEQKVIQNGFTRNKKLYSQLLFVGVKNVVLTVETVKDLKTVDMGDRVGLYGVPDYKTGDVELYYGKSESVFKSGGSCGSGSYTHTFDGKKIEIASNCFACYKRKLGCFM